MKKLLIALALCLLMVGLMVSPALAATQKVPLINDSGNPNPGTGYATFITNQGDNELVVNVTLKRALPNTTYSVILSYKLVDSSDWLTYETIYSFKTNGQGNWGGQNQQYSFDYVLPKGRYNVFLRVVSGNYPDSFTDDFVTPLDNLPVVRLTGN